MVRYPSVPVPLPSRVYYGWVIVATSLMMNVATTALNPVIFSFFIAPMSSDLGYSRGTLAWALTVRLLVSGVTSPFLGRSIDRFGSRWLGVAGGLGAGVCLIVLGYVSHIWWIFLIFGISGALGLGGGPGGNLVTTVPVAKWFNRRRGRAMSIVTVGMAGGTVVGIPIAQTLINTVGWREAWALFGVVMLCVIAPLSFLFMRRSPEDLGIQIEGAAEGRAATEGKDGGKRSMETDTDWTVEQALRSPALWMVLGSLVLCGVAVGGTLIYRVGYWKDIGLSSNLVAFGTALDPLMVIFAVMPFGLLAERISLRVVGLIGCLGLGAAMLPMIFPSSGVFSIITHNVTFGIAAGAYVTVNNLIWPNYFGRKHLGSIRGVVLPIIVAANAFAAPLYGLLLDKGVPPASLWAMTAVLFILAGVMLFMARQPVLKASAHKAIQV